MRYGVCLKIPIVKGKIMKIMRAVMSMEDNQTQDYQEINQEVGDSLIEVHEADNELEGITSDIEEAQDVGDAVSEIAEHVETAQETEGGLSEAEAETINIAVEHLCRSIGYRRKAMPSLESHYSDKKRASVALEGLGEIVSSIWEAIKAAFKKVGEAISSLFNSIFKNKKAVQEKAKTVSTESKSLITVVQSKPKVSTAVVALKTATTVADYKDVVEAAAEKEALVGHLADVSLVKYFRTPDGNGVYESDKILDRFKKNLNGIDTLMSDTNGLGVGQFADYIDKRTASLELGVDKKERPENSGYVRNLMKNFGNNALDGFDNLSNPDKDFDSQGYTMAFDTTIAHYFPKDEELKYEIELHEFKAVAWPELNKEDAVLSLAHPKLTAEVADQAYKSAQEGKLEKDVKKLEESLKKLMSKGEELVTASKSEEDARAMAKKVNSIKMSVVRVIGLIKLMAVYQLEMTNKVLSYVKASNNLIKYLAEQAS